MEGVEDAKTTYRTIQSGSMMKRQSHMTLKILFCQWTEIGQDNSIVIKEADKGVALL